MIVGKPVILHPLPYIPVGWSFFVPSYDTLEIEHEMYEEAAKLGIGVAFARGIEHGLYGVRVYRTA